MTDPTLSAVLAKIMDSPDVNPADVAALSDLLLDAPAADRVAVLTRLVEAGAAGRLRRRRDHNRAFAERGTRFSVQRRLHGGPVRDPDGYRAHTLDGMRRELADVLVVGSIQPGRWYAFQLRESDRPAHDAGEYHLRGDRVLALDLLVCPLDGGVVRREAAVG